MNIESLAVAVRPRGSWEAIDLGPRLIHGWAGAIYKPWLIAVFLTWVLVNLINFPLSSWWLSAALIWWLKPLLGRFPLFVLSRAMFGSVPSTGETLRFNNLGNRILPDLFFLRFSPIRTVNLPVVMLENVSGKRLRKRKSLVGGYVSGSGIYVTLIFLAVEWLCLFLGVFGLASLMIPDEWSAELSFFLVEDTSKWWVPWFLSGCYALVVAFLEPFYVAIGFSLYLNRRTTLEAWDLDLAFRRLARRIAKDAGRAAMLVLLLCTGLAGDRVAAQEPDPKIVIEQVLEDPIFPRQQTEERRRFREWDTSGQNRSGNTGLLAPLSTLLWIFLVGLAVALLGLLVYWIVKPLKRRANPQIDDDAPGSEVSTFANDLFAEALPDDPVDAARAAWLSGQYRQALSLLFRGALVSMAERDIIQIEDCATEEEVLKLVRRTVEDEFKDFFTGLTRAWQKIAYAHRSPSRGQFEQLCQGWTRFLGGEQ